MPSKSKIRALRSASASVRPPPPSPLPGMDQSMGAKSIRPEDAAHMTIPAVGSAGAAGLAALTLLILWSMEQFSEWIARPTGGEAARECEQLVREVLDPFWTVAIAYAVFAIGAAVFLFLWRTCGHTTRNHHHTTSPGIFLRDCLRLQVREREDDPLLDLVEPADGLRPAARKHTFFTYKSCFCFQSKSTTQFPAQLHFRGRFS